MSDTHYCYILKCKNDTYNGYTNNLYRRLRQHNGVITGGAKHTSKVLKKYQYLEQWSYVAVIEAKLYIEYKIMLSLEWSIKYPDNKRPRPKHFNSPDGRILGLARALCNPKFSDIIQHLIVYVQDEYFTTKQDIVEELQKAVGTDKVCHLSKLFPKQTSQCGENHLRNIQQ